MMAPIFTLNLNKKILPHRIAMGKYDGLHPCLTAVTANDKIFIHNPHTQVKRKGDRWLSNVNEGSDISLLNVQQSVSCIACGTLKPDTDQDILFVGMSTSLLAYDVENNSDVFFKEIQDGVNCITIGKVGHSLNNLVLAGGNSSLQSFDHEGNDKLWTVIGDNVSSMALVDFNQDSLNELIVGSEDFDIRAFKDDQMIMEVKETEAVTGLCSMMEDNFGYALANGTVGVYKKQERVWRIKSKNQAVSIFSFDMDGDGYPELLTGWSNGKVDARNINTGEVVFKDNFGSCIAGLTQGDYNMDGQDQLIITAVDGEVRGYTPSTLESRQQIIDATFEQETIRELSLKKQHLLLELHNYEENARVAEESNGQLVGRPTQEMDNHGVIPANTQLKTGLTISMGSDKVLPHVEIAIETTNDTIVRAVLIFAEGIFEGECLVVHEKESKVSSSMRIPLFPPKDVPVDLHIKAFIGYKGSDHFHVFELTRQLPRFAMYALTTGKKPDEPNSSASFTITAPTYRVVEWLNNNFLLLEDVEDKGFINIKFVSLRTAEAIVMSMDENGSVSIKSDSMELAGDIIQSMAESLSIEELVVLADYPQDVEKLKKLLVKVDELQSIRQRLFADMADNSGAIRSLILHAEDARLMEDYKAMRHWYQELNSLNRDLLNSYRIRAQNQEELLSNLKKINQIIQRAGRLRVGKAKTLVISGCRNAIKENNIEKLIKIISVGEI